LLCGVLVRFMGALAGKFGLAPDFLLDNLSA
jgi:hypothetical protein